MIQVLLLNVWMKFFIFLYFFEIFYILSDHKVKWSLLFSEKKEKFVKMFI